MTKYGEGSIYYETSRGKWHASISTPQGERIHKRFNTEEEANAWRLGLAASFLKGDFIPKNDITIGTWLIQYLRTFVKPKVREKTFLSYTTVAAHITDEFAAKELQKIKPIEAQAFLNELDVSDSMKERVKKLLCRLSKKAYALEMIKKDFMLGVEIAKPEPKSVEIFRLDELKKILDVIENNKRLRRHRLFISLAIASGCRLGELLALTPNDIKDNSIHITKSLTESRGVPLLQPPKTKAGYRYVTLPSPLMAQLRQSCAGIAPDDYLFKNAHGKPCLTSNMGATWRRIVRAADVPYRKFHCLRHTHASMMLAAGVPVLEIAKRLGHSRASHTLNLYGHAIPGYDSQLPSVVEKVFQLNQPSAQTFLTEPQLADRLQPHCNQNH